LDARNRPVKFLSIVVDGMDQNTTMVPKMQQTVKNIEGRYLKTHLCGNPGAWMGALLRFMD
jgi:hypothetical protein